MAIFGLKPIHTRVIIVLVTELIHQQTASSSGGLYVLVQETALSSSSYLKDSRTSTVLLLSRLEQRPEKASGKRSSYPDEPDNADDEFCIYTYKVQYYFSSVQCTLILLENVKCQNGYIISG